MIKTSKTKLLSIAFLAVVMAVAFAFGISAFASKGGSVVKAATLEEVPVVSGYTAFGWTDGENLYAAGDDVDGDVVAVYARLTEPQISLRLNNGPGMKFRTELQVRDNVLKPRQLAKLAGIQSIDLVLSYVDNAKTFSRKITFANIDAFDEADKAKDDNDTLELIATLTGNAGELATKSINAKFSFGEINAIRSDIVPKEIAIDFYKNGMSDGDKTLYGDSLMASYEITEDDVADPVMHDMSIIDVVLENNKVYLVLGYEYEHMTAEQAIAYFNDYKIDFESTSNWQRNLAGTGFIKSAENGVITLKYEITSLAGGATYNTHYGYVAGGNGNAPDYSPSFAVNKSVSLGSKEYVLFVRPGTSTQADVWGHIGIQVVNQTVNKLTADSLYVNNNQVILAVSGTNTYGGNRRVRLYKTDDSTYTAYNNGNNVSNNGTFNFAINVAGLEAGTYTYQVRFASNSSFTSNVANVALSSNIAGTIKTVELNGKSYTLYNNNGTIQLIVVEPRVANALNFGDITAENLNAVTVTGVTDGEAVAVKVMNGNAEVSSVNATVTDGTFSANVAIPAVDGTYKIVAVFDGSEQKAVKYVGDNKYFASQIRSAEFVASGTKGYTISNNNGVQITVADLPSFDNSDTLRIEAENAFIYNLNSSAGSMIENTSGSAGKSIGYLTDNGTKATFVFYSSYAGNANLTLTMSVGTAAVTFTQADFGIRLNGGNEIAFTGTVRSTGSWNSVFDPVELGTVTLQQGVNYLVVTSKGQQQGNLDCLDISPVPTKTVDALTADSFTEETLNAVTVTGVTDGAAVAVKVMNGVAEVSSANATVTDGAFSANVAIPAEEGTYRIVVVFDGSIEKVVPFNGNKEITVNGKTYTISNNNGVQISVVKYIPVIATLEAEDADVAGVPTPSWWSYVHGSDPFTVVETGKPAASGGAAIGSLNSVGATIAFTFTSTAAGEVRLDLYMASNAGSGTSAYTFTTSTFTATIDGVTLNFEPKEVAGGTDYSTNFEAVVLGTVDLEAGEHTVVITVVDGTNMGNMDCLRICSSDLTAEQIV